MKDNFYEDPFNIIELINEMNRLSNGKYNDDLHNERAPYIYLLGKCYYFASALKTVLEIGELYMCRDPLHVMLKVSDLFYDAYGMMYECDCRDYFKIDPKNNSRDLDLVNTSVANEYDDKYLFPVLVMIAKEADDNIRKNNCISKKLIARI